MCKRYFLIIVPICLTEANQGPWFDRLTVPDGSEGTVEFKAVGEYGCNSLELHRPGSSRFGLGMELVCNSQIWILKLPARLHVQEIPYLPQTVTIWGLGVNAHEPVRNIHSETVTGFFTLLSDNC